MVVGLDYGSWETGGLAEDCDEISCRVSSFFLYKVLLEVVLACYLLVLGLFRIIGSF